MSYQSSNPGAAQAISRAPGGFTIRQETRAAILAEQLAYLLDHADFCPEECPQCERLRAVEEALLLPFRKVGQALPPAK